MADKKPRGYFDFILAMDCETTGLCFSCDSPVYNPETTEEHQALSWGLIVVDAHNLEPVEELYLECAWNDSSRKQRSRDPKFGTFAEKVHGMTFDYLEEHAMSEEDMVAEYASLVLKYWGPKGSIVTLGHNVHTFDMPFMRHQARRHGIELNFNNRHVDTNSIGFVNWETYNSDDLFELLGFDPREDHNALDDIRMTLKAAQVSRLVFQDALAG